AFTSLWLDPCQNTERPGNAGVGVRRKVNMAVFSIELERSANPSFGERSARSHGPGDAADFIHRIVFSPPPGDQTTLTNFLHPALQGLQLRADLSCIVGYALQSGQLGGSRVT